MVQAKLSTHVDVVVVIIVIVDIVFIVSVVVDVCSNTKKNLKYFQREQHGGASTQRLHNLSALSSPQGFTTRSGE